MVSGWDSNPHSTGFKPGRSAVGVPGPSRRKPWDSNPQAAQAATCFQDRPLIRPDGFREGEPSSGLESFLGRQRFDEMRRHYHQQLPRIREGGFEPPPPDSKSGSLPVSRFPRAPRGSRTRLSGLGSPRLTARPGTPVTSHRVRVRGVEPRSPGWKPGVVPLDQSRELPVCRRKERESNPQGSSLARIRAGCRRRSACPSIVELRRQESNLRSPG